MKNGQILKPQVGFISIKEGLISTLHAGKRQILLHIETMAAFTGVWVGIAALARIGLPPYASTPRFMRRQERVSKKS